MQIMLLFSVSNACANLYSKGIRYGYIPHHESSFPLIIILHPRDQHGLVASVTQAFLLQPRLQLRYRQLRIAGIVSNVRQ